MGIFKFEGIIGRIDIRFMPYESFYFAYLYFTGGVDLNRNMRLVAITHGYKLNEYGLYKDGSSKSIIVESEKEIFDILGLNYLQPKDRS
jgi:DNA polymerase/3'-5' exonuclease PolX